MFLRFNTGHQRDRQTDKQTDGGTDRETDSVFTAYITLFIVEQCRLNLSLHYSTIT